MNTNKRPKAFEVTVISGDSWFVFPGVEYEGKLWFAPKWRLSPDKKVCKLDVMVRFDNLRHQAIPKSAGAYLVNNPIPKSVLDGQTSVGFEIQMIPDLLVDSPDAPTIQ